MSRNEALHSGRHNERVQLYAFDMLAGDGEDHRQLPLSLRKTNLARLLRRIPGVFIAEYEQGEIGRIYSASPVVWASKASSRNAAIAPIPPGNAGTG
jgi:ATP-dependent DNA ligase